VTTPRAACWSGRAYEKTKSDTLGFWHVGHQNPHVWILGRMNAPVTAPDFSPADWCMAAEGSRIVRVSVETLRAWADSGRVPCQHIGKVRIFRRADLERIASEQER
jgi:hypothetical protein